MSSRLSCTDNCPPTFADRRELLAHIISCPNVFPGVQRAAEQEYRRLFVLREIERPRSVPPPGRRTYPDLFENYETKM